MATSTFVEIVVARDFSATPGPRLVSEGDHSGELFRKEILLPTLRRAIDSDQRVLVVLDGTAGYGTSFLEEAFGGLVRVEGYTYEELRPRIEVRSHEQEFLAEDVDRYMREGDER